MGVARGSSPSPAPGPQPFLMRWCRLLPVADVAGPPAAASGPCPARVVWSLLTAFLWLAPPVVAQDDPPEIDGAVLLEDVVVRARNDIVREPSFDESPVPVQVSFVLNEDQRDNLLANGRFSYVLEYGFYDVDAVCGQDFVFRRGDGRPGSCAAGSSGRQYRTADGAGTLPMVDVLGDTVPEYPNEAFVLWVRVQGFPQSEHQVTVYIENDVPVLHLQDTVGLEFVYPAQRGAVLVEGQAVRFRLRLSDVFPRPVCVVVRAVGQDAVQSVDFRGFDREVCIREFAALSDLMVVQTHADPQSRPDRTFYIVVEAVYENNPHRYEILASPVVIRDASPTFGVIPPNEIWIGPEANALSACRNGEVPPVVLVEPPPGEAEASYVVPFTVLRRAPGSVGCVEVPAYGVSIALRPLSDPASAVSAHPGVDFDVYPRRARVPAGDPFVFTVYGDGRPEPEESGRLVVHAGLYGYFVVPVVVVDHEAVAAFVAAGEGAYARLAREAGAMLAGAVADRFSCAGSPRCGQDVSTVGDMGNLLRSRVVRGARLLGAWSPPPGPVSGVRAAGSSGALVSGLGQPGAGVSSGGPFVEAPVPAPGGFDPLGVLGRTFARGVSFGGQPSTRDGSSAATGRAWSVWLRTVSRRSDAGYAGGGGAVRTRFFGLLAGLDRTSGPLTVGAAYGFLRGRVDSQLLDNPRDVLSSGVTWHVVAPYVGYRLDRRLRLWATSGFSLRASSRPLELGRSPFRPTAALLPFVPTGADGIRLDSAPGLRVNAVGLTATLYTPWWASSTPSWTSSPPGWRPGRRGRAATPGCRWRSAGRTCRRRPASCRAGRGLRRCAAGSASGSVFPWGSRPASRGSPRSGGTPVPTSTSSRAARARACGRSTPGSTSGSRPHGRRSLS